MHTRRATSVLLIKINVSTLSHPIPKGDTSNDAVCGGSASEVLCAREARLPGNPRGVDGARHGAQNTALRQVGLQLPRGPVPPPQLPGYLRARLAVDQD